MTQDITENYDGFYFLPGNKDCDFIINFFTFDEDDGDLANSKKVESNNSIGDIWHIALFTQGEKGEPVFNDSFEAIFSDPEIYAKNLCGTGIYGCVLRKTDKSIKWFNDYLNRVKNRVTIIRLK
jgi:hypothetical protein